MHSDSCQRHKERFFSLLLCSASATDTIIIVQPYSVWSSIHVCRILVAHRHIQLQRSSLPPCCRRPVAGRLACTARARSPGAGARRRRRRAAAGASAGARAAAACVCGTRSVRARYDTAPECVKNITVHMEHPGFRTESVSFHEEEP